MQPPATVARFAERRARALALLDARGALVLAAAPELHVGADTELRYHVDPSLYYLTGYEEPEAVLVLAPSAATPFTLFVRPRDAERELWTGTRGGEAAARELFGADAAFPIAELAARLPALLGDVDHLHYRLGAHAELDRLVAALLTTGRARRPRSGAGLHTVSDPGLVVDELRVVKDEYEVQRIRAAGELAMGAFRELRDVIRADAGEWEVEAALEAGFRRRGASGPSFPTIVGGGNNATVLHYTSNRSVLQQGDVVLVDGGARLDHYCSDITRSYPVAGRFTDAQRAVYEVVKRAHDAGIAAVRPGAPASDIHDAALAALVEGMVALGLLEGDPAELVAQPDAYRRYYPHRTSHWLGLDVHDVGGYVLPGGAPRLLEAGMVLTVEPGLYIPASDERAPASLRGIGIRLEDDVLVTAAGPEVLTAGLSLDPDALFG